MRINRSLPSKQSPLQQDDFQEGRKVYIKQAYPILKIIFPLLKYPENTPKNTLPGDLLIS